MALLVLQHGPTSGSMRLGEILRDTGHVLDTRLLHEGDPVPQDLDGIDGIIACGGPGSALDDSQAWLADEMKILKEANDVQLPIVAICLGSQILARALGGTVSAVPSGIQLGWLPTDLTEAGKIDPIHAGIGWKTMQPWWNRDHVETLPEGATLLATSEGCNAAAWSVGLRTYAFQYHPEIFGSTLDDWLKDDPKATGEAGISADDLGGQTNENFNEFRRISDRLFRSIAMCLMPVDRVNAGIAKALHH